MLVLVDSNSFAVDIRLRGESLCVTPQNLIEFWAVATRPQAENGLGLTIPAAAAEMGRIIRLFRRLRPSIDVLDAWRRIVIDLNVIGKQTHDAHLVAAIECVRD